MRALIRRVLWLVMATVLCFMLAGPALALDPAYTRQQRFGIGFVPLVSEGSGAVAQSLSQYRLALLRVGWYSDWRFDATPDMPADVGLEYVQLIRVRDATWPPNWVSVQNAVALNTGALWLIGNEPECPNQENLTPDVYAQRYHEAYQSIKIWDPTALVAIGGIVEPTPLRLLWLERTMEAYEQQQGVPMEVDVWNIHIQILPEGADTGEGYDNNAGAGVPVGIDWMAEGIFPRQYNLADCASVPIFQTMVRDFRQWMKDQGEQDKDLVISEMGVLMPSIYLVEGGTEAERKARGDLLIERFMVEVFDWLLTETDEETGNPNDDDLLVQRWLWFSLNGSFWDEQTNPLGFNGSLYDYQTQEPTRFGQRFIAYQNHPYQTEQLSLPLVLR